MRIGFDTAILGGQLTGVGTYTRNLILHLDEADASLEFRGFAGAYWNRIDPKGPGFAQAHAPAGAAEPRGPLSSGLRARFRQSDILRTAWRAGRAAVFSATYERQPIDLYHAFAAVPPATIRSGRGAPSILLIHDVSHIRTPEHHPAERVKWLERLPDDIAEAACINTVSEFSRAEIADVYGIDPDKIVVTNPGVDAICRPYPAEDCAGMLRDLDLEAGRYFLCVGSLESRKNLDTLIAAYARLPDSTRAAWPLVITGPVGAVGHRLPKSSRRLMRAGQIRVLGYSSRQRLAQLYSQAGLFLFPSVYEGFGMPLAEAMACGAPVACSDIGAFREVAGDLAAFIAAMDTDGWSCAMLEAAESGRRSDPGHRKRRIARGSGFSWDKTASDTLAMYAGVLAAR